MEPERGPHRFKCQHNVMAVTGSKETPDWSCGYNEDEPCMWVPVIMGPATYDPRLDFDSVTIDEEQRMIFFPLPADATQRELTAWWMQTAYYDLEKQLPKMYEYGGNLEAQLAAEKEPGGSADLTMMGWAMTVMLRWSDHDSPVALELAIWFYILGKVARLISDYQRQVPGKPDTWHDISVYSMMARRIQENGQWP